MFMKMTIENEKVYFSWEGEDSGNCGWSVFIKKSLLLISSCLWDHAYSRQWQNCIATKNGISSRKVKFATTIIKNVTFGISAIRIYLMNFPDWWISKHNFVLLASLPQGYLINSNLCKGIWEKWCLLWSRTTLMFS